MEDVLGRVSSLGIEVEGGLDMTERKERSDRVNGNKLVLQGKEEVGKKQYTRYQQQNGICRPRFSAKRFPNFKI